MLAAFFGVYLLSLAWTTDIDMGLTKLETKFALLAFPWVFGAFPIPLHWRRRILACFALGATAALIFCLALADQWSYKALGEPLNFHPTYFSLYLGVCLLWLFTETPREKRLIWLIGLFWIAGILLLASRMQWLALAVTGGGLIWYKLFQKGRFWKATGALTLALALLAGALWVIPAARQRLERLVAEQTSGEGNVRQQVWHAALFDIRLAPLAGVGIGDTRNVLDARYAALGYEEPLQDHLNAHNQYLQTALALGIPGVLLLAWILAGPLLYKPEPALILFLAMISLSFLTESMLETMRGTLFFSFFYSFLSGPGEQD